MHKIYEVRNKGTHRIEYLNLYNEAEEKPDDAFRRNPDCLHFAGRPDIYLSLREEAFEDKDKAWEYCMNLWVEYKLMSPEKLQENIETPRVLEKPKAKRAPKADKK